MGLKPEEARLLGIAMLFVVVVVSLGSLGVMVNEQIKGWNREAEQDQLEHCANLARREPSVWCFNQEGILSADG